jgi:predicted RNase H-like HicB family nuclease
VVHADVRIVVAVTDSDTVPVGTSLAFAAPAVWRTYDERNVVIFEQADDGGWGAYLPDLPGVVARGETRDEVATRIQERLDAYAHEMRSLGKELPTPTAPASTVQAA